MPRAKWPDDRHAAGAPRTAELVRQFLTPGYSLHPLGIELTLMRGLSPFPCAEQYVVSSGESQCMRSITDILDAPERSHVNVENMNQEFMKAVLEADPGMAKEATQNKLMMGLMPIMLKRSQGQALTVAERAQVQAFFAAMAVLRRLRPGVGVYLSAMMGVVLGEHGKTSIPIRIDGSVVGVACFIHKADSATGQAAFEGDTARLDQAAEAIAQAVLRAAPADDNDESNR